MGNSLHNKIYLGRRTSLLNKKRMQIAVCISATLGISLTLWAVQTLA